jgi:hypothetical protein
MDDFNGGDVVRVYEPVRCEHMVYEFAAPRPCDRRGNPGLLILKRKIGSALCQLRI